MYTIPSLAELHQLLVDLAAALFPELDTSRSSFPALFAKVVAAGATDNHAHLAAVLADLLPDTAEGAALDRWGAVVARPRKGATGARKVDALRLVNTTGAGVAYTAGAELVHVSGLRFQLNESGTVPATDSKDVDVVAIDTGVATRLASGEVLTFTTPIAGIEEDAVLVLDLDEDGTDQEGDGPYRARLLARFATPPMGGAATDYVQWSLESAATIAAAYCYPNRAGLNTVDVVAMHAGSGASRMLDTTERTTLLAYIDARRPTGATVRVLETLEQPEAVEILIEDTGEEAYAWDWDDSSPLSVSSWTAGTRTLVFTLDRPASMAAGGRLVVKKADGTGDGEVLTIESLSSTNAVVLAEAPTVAPVASDTVYAGGPLSEPVRDAVLAHIDALGSSNIDGAYGSWNGTLRPAALYGVCNPIAGVRDLDVVTPAANVDAVDPAVPDDEQIYVITPGRVIIRRKW